MRKWEKWWENMPDDYMLIEVQQTHPIRRLMAEEAKIGENVLDVACGQCMSYPFFRIAGLRYVGIDITKKFIDISRERYPGIESDFSSLSIFRRIGSPYDSVRAK